MQEMSKNIQPSYINYDIHTFHSYFLYLFVAFIIIIIIINRFCYYIKEGRVVLGQVRVLRVWMGCVSIIVLFLSADRCSAGSLPLRWERHRGGGGKHFLEQCGPCCIIVRSVVCYQKKNLNFYLE